MTGGTGHIGSHAVRRLLDAGHRRVVFDNLNRGNRHAVPGCVARVDANLSDGRLDLACVLRDHAIEAVMHFAALAYVGESVYESLRYYKQHARQPEPAKGR